MLNPRHGFRSLLVLGALVIGGCDGPSDNYGAPTPPPAGPGTARSGDNVDPISQEDDNSEVRGDNLGRSDDNPDLGMVDEHELDNTAQNERDRDGSTLTPLDQSENRSDVDITARVRRAILDDDTMSTNADNCKIITANGVVTLRGVVASEAERAAIEAKAAALAGVQRVDNQLEVEAR